MIERLMRWWYRFRNQRDSSDFNTVDSRTSGIQEAIDSLPRSGGRVNIPSGVHDVGEAIGLDRDNVELRGRRPGRFRRLFSREEK